MSEREKMEIELIKYTKKSWCKSAVLGFFIGLAVIVPGISGSTVAIIFKLYDQFLYALGNLLKKFKKCFVFLLPIGLGLIVGVLLGFLAVKKLLEILPFAIVCLFAGLMTGAFPAVKDEIKDAKRSKKRVALFAFGVFIPVIIGALSAWLSKKTGGGNAFADIRWYHFILALILGAVVSVTQIVPGLSASAFLMAVGWFSAILDSVSLTYWRANPAVFLVYAGLGLGFIAGILGFSKALTALFARARHTAYYAIVGLSLGSVLSMFCNGDILEVYESWANNTAVNPVLDILLGAVLFALGVVGAYALVRYQRKKDAEQACENA